MSAATECAASIDFDTALAILAAHAKPMDAAIVSFADAGGCYLADPIHARLDSPKRDCAAMDGYAVRDQDLATGVATLRQIGISYAGGGESDSSADGRETFPGTAYHPPSWRRHRGCPALAASPCRAAHRGERPARGVSLRRDILLRRRNR